jgi:hypothetical protein
MGPAALTAAFISWTQTNEITSLTSRSLPEPTSPKCPALVGQGAERNPTARARLVVSNWMHAKSDISLTQHDTKLLLQPHDKCGPPSDARDAESYHL